MTAQTCAVINQSGNIVNVIIADPAVDTVDGHTLVASDTAAIGGTYLNGVFTAPTAPLLTAAQTNALILAQIAALEAGQQRSLRQVALGKGDVTYTKPGGTTSSATQELAVIESQINTLRSQLIR